MRIRNAYTMIMERIVPSKQPYYRSQVMLKAGNRPRIGQKRSERVDPSKNIRFMPKSALEAIQRAFLSVRGKP